MASLTVIQGSGIFSQQQDGIVGTPSPTHHSDQLSLPSILTMDKMNSDFSKSSIDASNLLDTTYQRAILSARARLLGGEPPRYPEEWRLPYAPLPARPDLTRTVFFGDQRIGHRKEHRRRGRDRSKTHPMSETDSFTTDYSMQLHLPPLNVSHDALSTSTAPQTSLPSATGTSRLQLKSPRSDRVYLPFVGMATLHPKLLTSTDVREKEYDIPQFCYGCRKFMEFTHAQHSSNGVYVHFDDSSSVKPLSNDENLKDERQHPDMSNAVNLVEFPKRGEFCHGCDVSSKPHLHLLQSASSAGGITLVTQHDDVTTPSEQKQGGQGEKDSSEHPAIEYSQDDLEDFLRHPRVEDIPAMIKKIQKPLEPLHQPTKARQRPPRIPQCVLDILKSGSIEYRKKLFEDRCTACMEALQKYFPEYFQRKVPTNPAPSSGIGTSITSSEFWAEEQQRLKDRQELLEARKKLRLEEKERQKIEELERQKRLYTAPKPFQLKPVEPKTTEAKDPFSKDRKIDLPKSKPFEIKKSSKPVTKSIPVSHERTTWKEPKKFEIKKEPPKVTNTDWKPPPKPNRIPSIVQQPLPPTPHEEPIEEKKTAEKTAEEEEKKPLSPIEESLEEQLKKIVDDANALIPKDSNRKSKTAKIPRPVLKRSTPKKTAKIVQKPYKRTTFGPLPERQRSEPVHYGAAPEWPEERTPEPEPEVEKAPSPIPPPVESPIPEAVEPPVEVPSARTVSKQEAIMWKKRPEYRPKKFKPPAPSVIEQPTSSPEPDESNTLDYLAKYCIVFKSRVPFYQRIFNNYLRDQGVPIVDDVIHKSFTKERLKEHDAMTSSTSSKDPDVASVTSRTSGYVSGSNDDVGKVTNQDALQSTFAKSQPINELEEDDYISPMNIQQDSSDTDESEASDDNDENIMNNDVISNDDVSDGQEIGLTRDAKKRIEAKIGTKQLYNTFAADDYSKLLTFEIDRKSQRAEMLKEQLHTLNEGKNRTVAAIARKEFQEIFDPEWTQERSDFHARKEKEKTKKAAKKKGGSESVSQESIADVIPPVRSPTTLLQKSKKSRENNPPMKMEKLVDMTQTDEWILARLATNQWQTLSTIPEVKEMNLEIERTEEKITAAETQLIELKAENKMVNTVAKNLRGEEHITRTSMKDKFRRQQSMIYQRLNPLQEYEIDLAEFEKLLQQINGNLITEKECQFIFHILELPSRYRLNFKLFAVVAALSEKVSRLEPFIRKLINQMDFDALDVKMQRAKELFHLLEEEDVFGNRTGEIPVRNLAYELEAGGLKEDHIQMVTDKFDREDKGVVDFLDYVTYIPLFIDIHDSIVSDPFGTGSSFYSK
ncbi:uncharacterized protein [Apostichopus japonicus]|uniref:uncharacterized protein isoform X11 n=1 Tax=Stichopus japonicus TaxID=307972 RepID=UPI003AB6AB2A